jgi:putative hydrolase of the HAD superfamily
VLRAVLFDWGDTLMRWEWDEGLVETGHSAGLEAIGRGDLAAGGLVTERFRETVEPLFAAPGALEELDYSGLVRDLLAHFDVKLTDEELAAYLAAEHRVWATATQLGAMTHPLLESLRARGLKVGIVSNAFDTPELLHGVLEAMGVAERIDVAVFSSELGVRKPHPAIFERALAALEVDPADALFVGDRLYEDIRGASEVGMRTVQAVWFRADDNADGAEPDYQAFTQFDVLNIVDRLRA